MVQLTFKSEKEIRISNEWYDSNRKKINQIYGVDPIDWFKSRLTVFKDFNEPGVGYSDDLLIYMN